MISTRPVACKFHRKCDLSLRERAKRVRVADERGEGHLCMHYVALVGALAALRWRDELEHVTAPLAGELAEHRPNVLLRRTKLHSHQRLEQRWRRTLGSGRQRLRARLAQRIGCGARQREGVERWVIAFIPEQQRAFGSADRGDKESLRGGSSDVFMASQS